MEYPIPMTDPWCYIWCAMDPINILPLGSLGSRALPTALATRPVNATASATALEAEKP